MSTWANAGGSIHFIIDTSEFNYLTIINYSNLICYKLYSHMTTGYVFIITINIRNYCELKYKI